MINRKKSQFICFLALLTVINGASWILLKQPLAVLDSTDTDNEGMFQALMIPNLFGYVSYLTEQLAALSEIASILITGICFTWLTYILVYFKEPGKSKRVATQPMLSDATN